MKISLHIQWLSILALLFYLALFTVDVFADDIQDGIAAYKQGDFQTAYQAWHQAAENNVAEAQWMLAILLLNGQGVKQDKVAAYSWLTLASEKQHKQAMIDRMAIRDRLSAEELMSADTLSKAFRDKQMAKTAINHQKEKAFHWFEKAAKQGDPQAQYQLGEMLLNGEGVKQDKVAAYSWFSLASEQNQPQAIVKQAQLKTELSRSQIEKANALMLTNRDNHSITDKPPGLPDLVNEVNVKNKENQLLAEQSSVDTSLLEAREKPPSEKLEEPAKPTQVKPETKPKSVMTTVYRVQVGAFRSRQQVDIALNQLTKKSAAIVQKYETTITEPVENAEKPDFYRLQLGNFAAKSEAASLCRHLTENKQACFVVTANNMQKTTVAKQP
ncbi:MAG: SPOR domain-containing protein [Pseudomonadota bacterium]|nr:SPOR domain-containing protein [Pseudomonadota bacterium]